MLCTKWQNTNLSNFIIIHTLELQRRTRPSTYRQHHEANFNSEYLSEYLSGYRANARQGHLERVKRIIGYCYKFKHATLRYRMMCPDYSNLPDTAYAWNMTPYGNIQEDIPDNCPPPLKSYTLSVDKFGHITCDTHSERSP